MIIRRATKEDGTAGALLALVLAGIGNEKHVDVAKLGRFVASFCEAQGAACAYVAEENGALVAVAAGIVSEHPWLFGSHLNVIALTGRGGKLCLKKLEEWAREHGARGELLTLNPDKRYDRWARGEGMIPIRSYWRPTWQ